LIRPLFPGWNSLCLRRTGRRTWQAKRLASRHPQPDPGGERWCPAGGRKSPRTVIYDHSPRPHGFCWICCLLLPLDEFSASASWERTEEPLSFVRAGEVQGHSACRSVLRTKVRRSSYFSAGHYSACMFFLTSNCVVCVLSPHLHVSSSLFFKSVVLWMNLTSHRWIGRSSICLPVFCFLPDAANPALHWFAVHQSSSRIHDANIQT
jgi:hypothetical protein